MARPQTPVGAPKPPAEGSDHRKRLEALRDGLTESFASAGGREKAPLAGQLRAVLSELAALPTVTEVDEVDDLAAKRAARRSRAPAAKRPASG